MRQGDPSVTSGIMNRQKWIGDDVPISLTSEV